VTERKGRVAEFCKYLFGVAVAEVGSDFAKRTQSGSGGFGWVGFVTDRASAGWLLVLDGMNGDGMNGTD